MSMQMVVFPKLIEPLIEALMEMLLNSRTVAKRFCPS